MHLIKAEVYKGNSSSTVTAWVEPKTLIEKALADEVIEVENWHDGARIISVKHSNLPPELVGYEHTYSNYKFNKEDTENYCRGCIVECNPYLEGEVSKERIIELAKEYKTLKTSRSLVQHAFENENTKFGHHDKYWMLTPELIYDNHSNVLKTDVKAIKRVKDNLRKKQNEHTKTETKDLQLLLTQASNIWNEINYPCLGAICSGRVFYVSSFSALCNILPAWAALANLMEFKYGWAKLRKWPKLAKQILNSDKQISNEIYAYGLKISKEYELAYVLKNVFEPYINRMSEAYRYFYNARYTGELSRQDHPKGVQDGIARVHELINKKLERKK